MAEPTEKQKIGHLGEDIAQKYLENKGFSIIGQNYLKKYGEIDIIAKKGKILHFVEVKTVSEPAGLTAWPQPLRRSENIVPHRSDLSNDGSVSRETDNYRPEDNLHPFKLRRLARTTQAYLLEFHKNEDPEWVFDAITVSLDMKMRKAVVNFIQNIVL